MQQIEFAVDNQALATVKDIVINANFEEVETALREMVAPYASMIVTEDAIADAKTDRAKLRKVRASIDDYRKNIEKAYKEPVEVFKSRVKPLLEICDSGILNLDNQVKEFENRQKEEKIGALRDFFDKEVGEARDFLSFEQVNNPKWENKGFSLDDAKAEISEEIKRCIDGADIIRAIGNEFVPMLLSEFARTHDLSSVLKKNQELIARKEAEEIRRAKEAERIVTITAETAERIAKNAAEKGIVEETSENEPIYTISFKVSGTKNQISSLGIFMRQNGINFTRI